MKKSILVIITALLVLNLPANSFAVDSSLKKDEVRWDPPSSGPVIAWDAPVCGKGEVQVQPYFFYNRTRGVFDEEGHYKSFRDKERKWQWVEAVFLQYGVTDKLEISGWAEAQQNIRHAEGRSAESSDFGDTYAYVRYNLTDENDHVPCVTGVFQFKFPTGKYHKADDKRLETDLTGSSNDPGAYSQGYGIVLSKCVKPFKFHADFLYNIPALTRIDGTKVRYGNYVNYDFAVEYILPKGFNLLGEINFITQGDMKQDGVRMPASDQSSMVICPGIGWANDKVEALLAYQRTLAGTNVDVNDSIVFTFVLKL